MKTRGISHFNIAAPFYEHFIPPNLSDTLLRLLALEDGQWVLDAAGGTGRIGSLLGGRGRRVVVVDLAMKMLLQAHSKDGLLTAQVSTNQLPLAANCFDRILVVDALHHIQAQSATVRELWRVLKPGGRLVIEEPDIQRWTIKVLWFAEKLAGMYSHFLAPGEIMQLFHGVPSQLSSEQQDHTFWLVAEKPLD